MLYLCLLRPFALLESQSLSHRHKPSCWLPPKNRSTPLTPVSKPLTSTPFMAIVASIRPTTTTIPLIDPSSHFPALILTAPSHSPRRATRKPTRKSTTKIFPAPPAIVLSAKKPTSTDTTERSIWGGDGSATTARGRLHESQPLEIILVATRMDDCRLLKK